MIGQMKLLLRVKDLKQEQAFRELQRKRQALREAQARTQAAEARLDESRRTFDAREDAIFADIVGRVVNLDALDATHARVEVLRRDHTMLEDVRERAIHVEARVEGEAERQGDVYRAAVRVRDKYTVLTEEMVAARDAERARDEETEIEDLFARPRRPAA